jgi:hypothetical protein
MSTGQGKLLTEKLIKVYEQENQGMFVRAYLGWALKSMSQASHYLYFYRNIVCKNIVCDVDIRG